MSVVEQSNKKPNHMVATVTIVLSCLLVVGLLIYDLHYISQHDYSSDIIDRQIALAATMLVIMIHYLVSGIAVYVGFVKKIKKLLLGYLSMTCPVMTFAAIYAIAIPVNEFSINHIVKIASVIIVCIIQGIVSRMVYKMYQWLKLQSHHGTQSPSRDTNRGCEGNSEDLPPVYIQLKPPPYEKMPPPYDLKSTGVNPSTSELPPSPPNQLNYITNTSSPDLCLQTTTFSSDLHLSPSVHTLDIYSDASYPTSHICNLPGTTEEGSRPCSTESYDVPSSSTTSVYHIHMAEEGLPTP